VCSGSSLTWRRRGSVCPYAAGTSDLDRGGGDKAATWRTQACQRTLPRRAKGRLCPGLDGALSALAARPMKRATRGPRH
jgi:hypothetical protein